jgi:hypothetical protein
MRASALLVLVAIGAAPNLHSQSLEAPPIIVAGLEVYKASDVAAALTAWMKNSPVSDQSIPTTRAAFEQIESAYGHMVGYDVLQVVPLGRYASRSYVVILYEKGPIYSWFDCYRRGEEWIVTGFLFNTKPDAILPPTMLGH